MHSARNGGACCRTWGGHWSDHHLLMANVSLKIAKMKKGKTAFRGQQAERPRDEERIQAGAAQQIRGSPADGGGRTVGG